MNSKNETNEMEILARFFLEKRVTTHITTKGGSFYNGLIVEANNEFLIINDRVLGQVEVYYLEIKNLSRYRGVNNGIKLQ